MQDDQSETVARLSNQLAPLRGLWNGFESDLAAMGVASIDDLTGRSADALMVDYCRRAARPVDPMLRPCFEAVVRFAETGEATPWWRIARHEAARERDRIIASTHCCPVNHRINSIGYNL